MADNASSVQFATMCSPKIVLLFHLFGIILLPSFVFTYSVESKDFNQENFQVTFKELHETNYTGIRSAFQWTFGETIKDTSIHNSLIFHVNDSLKVNYQLFGQIGFYTNGSEIGVHFSVNSVASSTPGPTFSCSNDFPFWNDSHSCFKSNYSLISNAIYFLDVEIRGKTIRGFISEPQKDLSDMDDPYVPRYLIGEIKWFNEVEDLKPKNYWFTNDYTSCDLLSQFITFNYAPELYNKQRRDKTFYRSYSSYILCGPQNSLMTTDWSHGIAIYISKPSSEINDTRSMISPKNLSAFHQMFFKM